MIDEKKYPRYQDYFKSFLGGWSFEGGDETLTIHSVGEEEMFDADTQRKKKGLCLRFVEKDKPMVLNVTNSEMIAKVTGSDIMRDWIGKKIIVGQTKIRAFGKESYVIRVRDKKPDNRVYFCEKCGQEIKAEARKTPSELVEISKRNCGKALCLSCMKMVKAEMEAKNAEQNDTTGQTDEKTGTVSHGE